MAHVVFSIISSGNVLGINEEDQNKKGLYVELGQVRDEGTDRAKRSRMKNEGVKLEKLEIKRHRLIMGASAELLAVSIFLQMDGQEQPAGAAKTARLKWRRETIAEELGDSSVLIFGLIFFIIKCSKHSFYYI